MIRRVKRAVRQSDDRGDTAVDTAVLIPAVLLIGLLLVMGGRIAQARGVVASAANEAARAASISRTVSTARTNATTTATTTLSNSRVKCSTTTVTPDLGAFNLPMGQTGVVTVRVECVVPLSDLGIPGTPGSISINYTGRSVLDTYRTR